MKGSYQALRASERHDEERVPKKYKKLSIPEALKLPSKDSRSWVTY